MQTKIISQIESKLNEEIISTKPIGGGCISDSSIIELSSGEKFFLKVNENTPKDMFRKEATGLLEIAKSKAVRVPTVKLVDDDFILMEFIKSEIKRKDFFEDFGFRFAQMHKYHSDHFGFSEDNYIGSTVQLNIASIEEKTNWIKFYFDKRLLFQFHLAEKNGYSNSTLRQLFLQLENRIEDILNSQPEKSSLLHGDLWSGNYITDDSGTACLIDPAVYYGNREADLAMTKLFGGFSSAFYKSYNAIYPLQDGYEYRENVYKLYHVLNHLNLFSGGYYQQAVSLIKFYF